MNSPFLSVLGLLLGSSPGRALLDGSVNGTIRADQLRGKMLGERRARKLLLIEWTGDVAFLDVFVVLARTVRLSERIIRGKMVGTSRLEIDRMDQGCCSRGGCFCFYCSWGGWIEEGGKDVVGVSVAFY